MGICYDFVCKDCKQVIDIGKDYNAAYIVPKLLTQHEGHSIEIYSDCGDDIPPEDYKEIDIWDKCSLKPDVNAIQTERWTKEQFWKYAREHNPV
jgi:hypothetical protein